VEEAVDAPSPARAGERTSIIAVGVLVASVVVGMVSMLIRAKLARNSDEADATVPDSEMTWDDHFEAEVDGTVPSSQMTWDDDLEVTV
jgi:hypothetical protein